MRQIVHFHKVPFIASRNPSCVVCIDTFIETRFQGKEAKSFSSNAGRGNYKSRRAQQNKGRYIQDGNIQQSNWTQRKFNPRKNEINYGQININGYSNQSTNTDLGTLGTTTNKDVHRKSNISDSESKKFKSILNEIRAIDNDINTQRHALPPIWVHRFADGQNFNLSNLSQCIEERKQILLRAKDVIDNAIIISQRDGSIQSSNKPRFVNALEKLLQCLSQHCISFCDRDNQVVSVYKECDRLCQLLSRNGYIPSNDQCHALVTTAAREGLWQEASTLFENQIDPETKDSSFKPTFQNKDDLQFITTGLYVVAKAARVSQSEIPVKAVMEAVLKLAKLSPQHSDLYLFAAGNALGYAKEWESLLMYHRRRYDAKNVVSPLIAAVMQSCIISKRYEDAIALYDELLKEEKSGAQDQIRPLCRDLAMRAYGGICSVDPYTDSQTEQTKSRNRMESALELFQQVWNEDGTKMSIEALTGVVQACEHAHCWRDAVDIWCTILARESEDDVSEWLIVDDNSIELFRPAIVTSMEHERNNDTFEMQYKRMIKLGPVLDHVMRSCNASKNFGLALLCLHLFQVTVLSTPVKDRNEYQHLVELLDNITLHSPSFSILTSFTRTIATFPNFEDLLSTTMVSLCGVDSPGTAASLFESIYTRTRSTESFASPSQVDTLFEYEVQNGPYGYAVTLKNRELHSQLSAWVVVYQQICKFTFALISLETNQKRIPASDASFLSSVLASIIRKCTENSQPETGLYLSRWAEARSIEIDTSQRQTFAIDALVSHLRPLSHDRRLCLGDKSPLILTDSLVASLCQAFCESGNFNSSASILVNCLGSQPTSSRWLLSLQEKLKNHFIQMRFGDALALFHELLAEKKCQDLFCIYARGLLVKGDYPGVIDVYNLSLAPGCLSEELTLLAMKAVCAKSRKTMNIPKSIAFKVLLAELESSRQSNYPWTDEHYWLLKRWLGASYARQLMDWEIPTSHLRELQLAIETIDRRSNAGMAPMDPALECIIKFAEILENHHRPVIVRDIPAVPLNVEGWKTVLGKVGQELTKTSLQNEPFVIDSLARSYLHVGCFDECVQLVNDALARGVQVQLQGLEDAVAASNHTILNYDMFDVEMLAMHPSK